MSELPPDAPINISELEREQLRFFLADGDLGTTLIELNPSLAWLSIFADLNLQQNNEAALATWVGKNLDSVDAVREVVARIHLFKADSARILDHQLNAQRDRISPLLTKCWELIVRHINNAGPGKLQNEWFEILPHIKRGEISSEVLMRITRILTPKLFVEKRYGWHDEPESKLERPTDILSIKYQVEDGVGEADFFGVWPKDCRRTLTQGSSVISPSRSASPWRMPSKSVSKAIPCSAFRISMSPLLRHMSRMPIERVSNQSSVSPLNYGRA
jgi:hypothetical protein